ncbi:tRNA pseudouridine(38-40) synthase TruA [Thermococcus thioreducens]|uniref:tRNA pseudouridine synthase A n=1 Tax=Thermococcus thioreducens TaxID=277988 RepID=A0A0Q2ULL6_9EURY|nr:tRNA pseudouridine(38-40) synthase TruA [Thermococcus thioreducens]ASJ12133.1 tRNA pseudouridine(38,39,40) synthase TruA [Thermococcus thioreducens]KQH81536.1 pseudouridine synthase [Thermococcus thioreducens]SEV96352.1 tRNA pseudouridine38-40 synthase [Thermococcus thioreducens]
MRMALRIAYDGTAFYGFQRQPDVRTVEGELLRVLEKLRIIEDAWGSDFKGASRTDRGVSAFFNVVAFDIDSRPDLVRGEVLNHHLKDAWVLGVAEVPEDFHPRFWAKSKTYRYYLVDEGFDENPMKECASIFVGRHDFSAFSKLEPGKDPVREITRIEITERPGYYVIEIEGKSFLWEMARRIVNAIRFCGLGLMEPEDVERMLAGDYRKKVPPAAPEGLILWHIEYEGISFRMDERGLKKAKRDIFERYSRVLTRAALFGDVLLKL